MKPRSLLLRCCMLAVACSALLSLYAAAEEKPAAYSDAEAGGHPGEQAVVTGKVASITKSGKGTTYVNLGDKFPRQTFSGVIFAKDADTIGDIAQFEGKTVALTGRIELSPDGKPQIVIRSPDQLKISDGAVPAVTPLPAATTKAATPAAPMLAPTVASLPASPSPKPTPPPKIADGKRIALAPNWANAPQTGDMTRKDLAALFGSQIQSGESGTPEDSIVIYPEVPYLTPLATARRSLHLENTTASRVKITTPGLPVASLTANGFNGIFPGGYTTLALVTDNSEQVVSVHLTDSNPRLRTTEITDTGGYHTYNFIAQRDKSAGHLVIRHDIVREGAPAGVIIVDSMVIDPGAADPNAASRTSSKSAKTSGASRQPRTGKILERSRWYVPQPLVNVILRASGNR